MTLLNFIPNDGYTEKVYLKGIPRLTSDVRIEVRPMLVEERSVYSRAASSLGPAETNQKAAGVIRERLVSWDLKDAKGQPVPITHENILRLKPALFERLFSIIAGLDAGDEDPEKPSEERKADAADKFPSGQPG